MFKVELINDHGDWILKSWEKTRQAADLAAEKVSESGYTARIISNGKIIKYFERVAK